MFIIAVFILMNSFYLNPDNIDIIGKIISIVWSILIFGFTIFYLKMPYKINIVENKHLTFTPLLIGKQKIIEIKTLQKINFSFLDNQYIIFKTDSRNIRMINGIENFIEFIEILKKINPNIK
jgi:hypothetical protein